MKKVTDAPQIPALVNFVRSAYRGGGGPMAEVTAGGNALKFYTSVHLQDREKEQLKRGDVVLLPLSYLSKILSRLF